MAFSPVNWMKPSDVMRTRVSKARKRILQQRFEQPKNAVLVPSFNKIGSDKQNIAGKRSNPFAQDRCSKRIPLDVTSFHHEDSCDGSVFQLLHGSKLQRDRLQKPSPAELTFQLNKNIELQRIHDPTILQQEPEKPNILWQTDIPIDWSLKTRLRFLSNTPFPWTGSLKTTEEASGVTGFTRCLHPGSDEDVRCNIDSSANATMYQGCLYWQHPNLPWLSMFPRTLTSRGSNQQNVALPRNVLDTLQAEWVDSLRSLFQLLRTRQCPYFYVCCPGFTVQFRSAGIAGISHFHAFITPSTRGLRQALQSEGVEFTMPLRKRKTTTSPNSQLKISDETLDDPTLLGADDQHDDEFLEASFSAKDAAYDKDVSSLLESIGLHKMDFPDLDNEKVKLRTENLKNMDHNLESLVCVNGDHIQGLYNFLLNSKSCLTSSVGSMADIPPTLLAPVAYRGASLKALKVKHGAVKRGGENVYLLDISGPILLNNVHDLLSILKTSSSRSFSAICSTLESSVALSMVCMDTSQPDTVPPPVFGQQSLSDCGLRPAFINKLCSQEKSAVINLIRAENRMYSYH